MKPLASQWTGLYKITITSTTYMYIDTFINEIVQYAFHITNVVYVQMNILQNNWWSDRKNRGGGVGWGWDEYIPS
jgi:type IV secretory pathway TrbL component